MISRVHISFTVSDIDAAVDFQARLFGAESSKRKPDYANFRLDAPALHLALVAGPADGGAQRHYGVELFDHAALEALHARAKAAGLSTRVEEQITCCYAVADKLWADDPDGKAWEFWVRTDDDGATLAPSQTGEASGAQSRGPQSSGPQSSGCCPTPEPAPTGCCG